MRDFSSGVHTENTRSRVSVSAEHPDTLPIWVSICRRLQRCSIKPEKLVGWDIFMLCIAGLIGFYDPFVISLYNSKMDPAPGTIAYLDDLFTLAFTIDMAVHCLVVSENTHATHERKTVDGVIEQEASCRCLEKDRLLTLGLDLITVSAGWISMFHHGETYSTNNILFILRLARLLQASRLYRVASMHNKVHSRYGYPMFLVGLFKLVWISLVTCHWAACGLLVLEGKITSGELSLQGQDKSWLSALIDAKSDPCSPNVYEDKVCQYLLAYYWAVTTLTSVGYGDITAQNKPEYVATSIGMLFVGFTWAIIVATIVSILSSRDPVTTEFRECLDGVADMAKRRHLPQTLRVRLRTFVHDTQHFMRMRSQRTLITTYFSEHLQRGVTEGFAKSLHIQDKIPWLGDFKQDALLDVARALVPQAFGPKERICMQRSMLVMQKGTCWHKTSLLHRGDVLGMWDVLLESQHLIDRIPPMTITFVELLRLWKETLWAIGRTYPDESARLRKAQVRTAVSRQIIWEAEAARAKKDKEEQSALGKKFAKQNSAKTSSFKDEDVATVDDLTSLVKKAAVQQVALQSRLKQLLQEM